MKFHQLKQVSDWHTTWRVYQHKIKNGDVLEIKWPDDTITTETIIVETWRQKGYGGMDESSSGDTLYIAIDYHGQSTKVKLVEGMMVRLSNEG
jgi:hypothetical protein